jgi:hypothetical protein
MRLLSTQESNDWGVPGLRLAYPRPPVLTMGTLIDYVEGKLFLKMESLLNLCEINSQLTMSG